jgi:hypothetical protein
MPATLTTDCLRPMSEVWIQNELDVAALNAKKNRLIQDSVDDRATTRQRSPSKKSELKSASDSHKADPKVSPRTDLITMSVCQISSTEVQSISDQGHLLISKHAVEESHSTGISSLRTQLYDMIGEWSCVFKQAMFQEDVALNEDSRHNPQLLILL